VVFFGIPCGFHIICPADLFIFIIHLSPVGSVTIFNANERLGESINKIYQDELKNDWLGRITHNED